MGAKAQHEKMRWNTTKTNHVRNYQLLTWSLPTEEVFRIHGQNRTVVYLPVVVFVLSRENAITKATEYVTFGFSFRNLVLLPF